MKYRCLLIISVIAMQGCTTAAPYRHNFENVCTYQSKDDCADSFITLGQKEQPKQYYLSFLEYDDQGQLHNPKARRAVTDFYRKLVREKDVMLITFVHGWHHNANGEPEDSNIVDFRELLELAAWEENRASKVKERNPRTIIGLYVGWRGRSLNGVLDYLTFWDRKVTAQEVGNQGVTDVLLELESIVKPKSRENKNNSMITIGHSFGAAALYSAIHPILMQRYISSRPYKSTSLADGFGDLVVLLNPAFEAMRYSSLFELSQDECRSYLEDQLPKLVILSSFADKPVRFAFQAGRLPALILEKHRKAKTIHCREDGIEERDMVQSRADVLAVGHFDPYVSHYLEAKTDSKSKLASDAYSSPKDAWLSQVKSTSREIAFSGTILKSKGRTRALTPYLNVITDRDVISSHNDIWNRKVRYFIKDLISVSSSID